MLKASFDCEWHGYSMGLDAELPPISGTVAKEKFQISSSK